MATSASRCDFDGVFYRIFCVTLLVTALAFTVILTNVFVDLDALIASKTKAPLQTTETTEAEPKQLEDKGGTQIEDTDEDYKPDYYEDTSRTKRSLDASTFQFHLKNPKMKQILTRRLSSLLEELDTEDINNMATTKKAKEETNKYKEIERVKEREDKVSDDKDENKIEISGDVTTSEMKKDNIDVMHLTLHNILLKGLVGHMDINEVYKRVQSLVRGLLKNTKKIELEEVTTTEKISTQPPQITTPASLNKIESKFLQELLKCKDLQTEIGQTPETNAKSVIKKSRRLKKIMKPKFNRNDEATTGVDRVENKHKRNPLLIKTTIDIRSNGKTENDPAPEDNVIEGIIKLVYNGKQISLSRIDQEITTAIPVTNKIPATTAMAADIETEVDEQQENNGNIVLTEKLIGRALLEYVQKHGVMQKPKKKSIKVKKLDGKNKRLKRNIKLRVHHLNKKYETITRSPKPKTAHKHKKKKDDDELYVEIETHFDSKGIKGEKKKKLIKSIVEKIQQAIHSDIELKDKSVTSVPGKPGKILKIRKRFQSPLTAEENKLMNKLIVPLEKVINRHIEPISKSINIAFEEKMPKVYYNTNNWDQNNAGPRFLTNTKSINSGEMGQVDLDFNKVLRSNGIPQRLQQPLNENIDEHENGYDTGEMKFFIKEFDGTGFSVGFNQYVGEALDPENMITGIQQILSSYNNYDQDTATDRNYDEAQNSYEKFETYHDMQEAREEQSHEIAKRDTRKEMLAHFDDIDDHLNEYQNVFDNKYMAYDNYQEIFEDQNKKYSLSIEKMKNNSLMPKSYFDVHGAATLNELFQGKHKNRTKPLVIDDNIFKRKLSPSQIFVLANLLTRKKRSISLKTYTKKIKPGLNKYINKGGVSRVFLKNSKRNKRQVDRIKIIATDGNPPSEPSGSEENLFVVSGENILADRAIRDSDPPDTENSERVEEEKFEYIDPYSYNTPKNPYANLFAAKSRHNVLMSKYPHILMEEMARSKEEDTDDFKELPLSIEKYNKFNKFSDLHSTNAKATSTLIDLPGPVAQDLTEALAPHTNYKLTVKITPKNESDVHAGFKEVHTSINKSVNKGGMLISSQMNISEISKVENLEKDVEMHNLSNYNDHGGVLSPIVKHLKNQQDTMKKILKQHTAKIDEQLDHLKKEKQNIENIIVKPEKRDSTRHMNLNSNINNDGGIDVFLPLNPPQLLHLNKAEAGQLISSALMKLHESPQLNDVNSPNNTCILTEKERAERYHLYPESTMNSLRVKPTFTTTQATTTMTSLPTPPTPPPPPPPPVHQTRIDPDRLRILRTIQRNENLTHAILSKIDRNTDLLQTFLQKLTEKIEPPPEPIRREVKYPKHEKPVEITTQRETYAPVPVTVAPMSVKNMQIQLPFPKELNGMNPYIDAAFYNRWLALQNMQHMQNLPPIPMMPNMPSMPNMPNMPNMQNIPNMQNMANAQNIHHAQNMPNAQNMANINMNNMQTHLPNLQGPNAALQNMENPQNAQNLAMQTQQSMPPMPPPQNNQNMPNIQNMQNIQNNQQIPVANVPQGFHRPEKGFHTHNFARPFRRPYRRSLRPAALMRQPPRFPGQVIIEEY